MVGAVYVHVLRTLPRMRVPGERMTEESYATLSWNQPPVKFKAEMYCVLVRERVFFGFNRYAQTRPRRVLYNVHKRFHHFSSSPKKKKKSNYQNIFETHFPELTSVLVADSLLCLLSTENGCLEVVI